MLMSTSPRARLLLLAGFVSLPAFQTQAQNNQHIQMYNDANLYSYEVLEMLSMGAAYSNRLNGSSFIGFNLKKMSGWTSQWRTGSDGGNNGAAGL